MGEVVEMRSESELRRKLEARAVTRMIGEMGFGRHYLQFGWDGVPSDDKEFLVGRFVRSWEGGPLKPGEKERNGKKRNQLCQGFGLFGNVGVGKTTAASLAMKELVVTDERRYKQYADQGRYITLPTYRFVRCTSLVDSLCSDDVDLRALGQTCRSSLILIIDDLGADGTLPAWRQAKFEDFVTDRWSNGLTTCFTTNLKGEDEIGAVYGNATADRLIDKACVWCHRWSTTVSQRSERERFREVAQ